MRKLLNLGSGPIHLDSFDDLECENSDAADNESSRGWDVESRLDFTKHLPFADESVDYIVAWHIWEHCPMHETGDIIKEWKRVLKTGTGSIFLACPDIKKVAQHIVDRDGPWQDWFICMVNIYGPYNGFIGDLHRWGYNYEELRTWMLEQGFNSVQELTPPLLGSKIGMVNAQKLGFAEYNLQMEIIK